MMTKEQLKLYKIKFRFTKNFLIMFNLPEVNPKSTPDINNLIFSLSFYEKRFDIHKYINLYNLISNLVYFARVVALQIHFNQKLMKNFLKLLGTYIGWKYNIREGKRNIVLGENSNKTYQVQNR